MSTYDMARKISQMPGFQVESWINPALISPRVKKMAQKMIRSGVFTGGYRSTARMLATQLMGDAGIKDSAAATKWGVTIFNAKLTPDTRAEILNLLEAARMVELANEPDNTEYIKSRYERAMAFKPASHERATMSCFVFPIALQIAELVAAGRPAEQIEAANTLADRLDDIAPIKANIHTPV